MDAPEITIRTAHARDAEDLARLASQLGYPATAAEIRARLDLLGTRSSHEIYVAQMGEDVVGWLHVLRDMHLESGEFVEIAGLVVDDKHRGRGVGKALVATAEAWALRQGVSAVRVRTNVVRKDAHAFYVRAGYSLQKEQKVLAKSL